MEQEKLNKLITKISFTYQFLSDTRERDPLVDRSLLGYVSTLKATYSAYLYSQLTQFYKKFFTNDEIDSLERYLIGGVEVAPHQSGMSGKRVCIKPFPLRIEVSEGSRVKKEVLI